MKFVLGVETITTINDGGLGIRYFVGKRPTQFQPGGIRPVLSIEVHFGVSISNVQAKRQRATKKNN